MQKFLGYCQELGLNQTTLNGQKLRNGITAGLADCSLFFICAFDFVYNPNDRKFFGIENVFVHMSAPYPLNIGPEFRPMFKGALTGAKIGVQPPVLGGRKPMLQPKGVQFGRVGNYNLQTSALELIVTDKNGMDYDSGLTSVFPNLKKAFAKPPSPVTEFTQHDLDEMRTAVTPYWGGDTWRLGL
jgi:hypothetical protein